MPSKEEYKERYYELSQRFFSLFDFLDDDVTEREIENIRLYNMLIDDHFELKVKYSKILDDVHDYRYETHCMKMTIRNLCEHFGVSNEEELQNIYLNKPYKLEDLKEDMWVYDIKYDEFCRIDFIAGIYPHRSYSDGTCEDGAFEENRFYPVQMANLMEVG